MRRNSVRVLYYNSPSCRSVSSADTTADSYETHFGLSPDALTERFREAVDQRAWSTRRDKLGKLGSVVVSVPEGAENSGASTSKHKACRSAETYV